MNSSQRAPDLPEFSGALAASIEFLCAHHPGDPQILDWIQEVLRDAIDCHSLDQHQALQLRSEVWQRLQPTTRDALRRLKQRQEAA